MKSVGAAVICPAAPGAARTLSESLGAKNRGVSVGQGVLPLVSLATPGSSCVRGLQLGRRGGARPSTLALHLHLAAPHEAPRPVCGVKPGGDLCPGGPGPWVPTGLSSLVPAPPPGLAPSDRWGTGPGLGHLADRPSVSFIRLGQGHGARRAGAAQDSRAPCVGAPGGGRADPGHPASSPALAWPGHGSFCWGNPWPQPWGTRSHLPDALACPPLPSGCPDFLGLCPQLSAHLGAWSPLGG